MIECIEELGTPLHRQAFSNPDQADCPADNEVKVLEPWAYNVVAARIAERTERLLLHGVLVEPLGHCSLSVVHVSHDVGAAEVIQRVGLVARYQSRERPSSLKSDDTRHFPISRKHVGSKRQPPNRTQYKSMADVEA